LVFYITLPQGMLVEYALYVTCRNGFIWCIIIDLWPFVASPCRL